MQKIFSFVIVSLSFILIWPWSSAARPHIRSTTSFILWTYCSLNYLAFERPIVLWLILVENLHLLAIAMPKSKVSRVLVVLFVLFGDFLRQGGHFGTQSLDLRWWVSGRHGHRVVQTFQGIGFPNKEAVFLWIFKLLAQQRIFIEDLLIVVCHLPLRQNKYF